jgi:hypothetical protein
MKTTQILNVLKVLVWIAFVGYCIEAGGLIVSFAISCVKPETARNLYTGRDYYNLYQLNFNYYTLTISFLIALGIMKSYVWYLTIKVMSDINLKSPFDMDKSQLLERIAYLLLGISIVGLLGNIYRDWIRKKAFESFGQSNPIEEFLFMAGLVYIVSQLFKRGVEIQSENELTV